MKSLAAMLRENRKISGLLVFIFSFLPVLFTLTDIGISWDEVYINDDAAKLYTDWLKLAVHDIKRGDLSFASKEVADKYFGALVEGGDRVNWHPPLARFMGGLSWYSLKDVIGEYRAYRLPSAVFFAIESMLLFLLVSKYFGAMAGLLSSVSLILMPHVFGHAHIFALDTPISAMWFLTVFSFVYGLQSRRWALATGILLGLSLSTKIHALLIPAALVIWYILTRDRRAKMNFLSMTFFTFPVFIISWPWLWHNTFNRAMGFEQDQIGDLSTNFKFTYYLGELKSWDIPWHYVPVMVIFTVPPLMLIAAIASIINIIKEGKRSGKITDQKMSMMLLFLVNAAVMLGAASSPGIPKYDSVRLFLPAFTFIAGLSGIGAAMIVDRYGKKVWHRIAACSLFLIFPFVSLLMIHPYELSYYNILIGGLSGAQKIKLETTYWGDTFNKDFLYVLKERYKGKKILYCALPDELRQLKFYNKNGYIDSSFIENGYSTTDAYSFNKSYDYLVLNSRQGVFKSLEWFCYDYMIPDYTVSSEGVQLISVYKSIENIIRDEERRIVPSRKSVLMSIQREYSDNPEKIWLAMTGYWDNPIVPEKIRSISIDTMLLFPASGTYRFALLSKGNIEFSIDKSKIHPLSSENSISTYSVQADAGFHLIDISIKKSGSARFMLVWQTPEGEKGPVKPRFFVPVKN
ncbi:MAG: glycosyltransferase family 39 protein [Candidatus Schekmanbacteria bacterium]|nr:glycosyltransferase family 39 protein [Candidatus Schekmanbacteria bacterium]